MKSGCLLREFECKPEFLVWLFISSGFINEVVAYSVGVSYPAINSSDLINIKIPTQYYENYSDNDFTCRIYSIFGSIVHEDIYKKELDVYALRNGMYIVEVTNNINRQVFKNKMVIAQ